MARIVEIQDKTPLIVRKDQMEKNAVAVCRCGLAASWPFCDGSHKETAGEDGDLTGYRRNTEGELERVDVAEGVATGDVDPRAGIPDED